MEAVGSALTPDDVRRCSLPVLNAYLGRGITTLEQVANDLHDDMVHPLGDPAAWGEWVTASWTARGWQHEMISPGEYKLVVGNECREISLSEVSSSSWLSSEARGSGDGNFNELRALTIFRSLIGWEAWAPGWRIDDVVRFLREGEEPNWWGERFGKFRWHGLLFS